MSQIPSATPPSVSDPPHRPPAGRLRSLAAPFVLPLIIVSAHFILFTLARLVLLAVHSREFAALSGGEVAMSFIRGIRFDASIIFTVLGVPMFFLMLPFGFARSRAWQRSWGWFAFAVLVCFSFVLACDIVYFGTVHRHVGHEVTAVAETVEAIGSEIAARHGLPLAAFVAAAAGLCWGWKRLLNREALPAGIPTVQLGAALLLAGLMYVGERGSASGSRLKPIAAFEQARHTAAYLALNGPFCLRHSLNAKQSVKADFYPWPDAVRQAQEVLLVPGEAPADPQYPLLRSLPARVAGKPNVVLIMLESWDAFYIDVHRRELGLAPLGITPWYDALSREGVLYSRFYACGQRSMDGMSAMICGFPTLPQIPYLGRGMEQSTMTYLGHLAKREGYGTYFIQSCKRATFRNDAVAELAGFETYLGAEDVPPSEPVFGRSTYTNHPWDHEMFDEAHRRLVAAKEPFLAFLYTNTTHTPFSWPDVQWQKRPGNAVEDRYLNSLSYADWALGRFFAGARKSEYFRNTIFIITSDHVGGPAAFTSQEDPATLVHTPCLILAPGLEPGINRKIGSQLDVIPTIMDLAGWSGPHGALGTSLFADPAPGRGAFCVLGSLVLRVEEGGSVVHNLSGRTLGKAYIPGADLDAVERRLLSVTQAAYTLLKTNRLNRKE